MHDHPWHERIATTEHYQWFKNLVELHEITASWLRQLQVDPASHVISRGLSRDVSENLWLLDSIAETKLDPLLDDTYPEDLLGRLDHSVWAVQALTLGSLLEKTASTERSAMESVLEQSSWKLGRACAEKRWPRVAQQGGTALKKILLALNDSPFAAYPTTHPFLVQRSVEDELLLELRACPHQSSYPEVREIADSLCVLHTHWIRGFAYALNHKTAIEYRNEKPRCVQRWYFVS